MLLSEPAQIIKTFVTDLDVVREKLKLCSAYPMTKTMTGNMFDKDNTD